MLLERARLASLAAIGVRKQRRGRQRGTGGGESGQHLTRSISSGILGDTSTVSSDQRPEAGSTAQRRRQRERQRRPGLDGGDGALGGATHSDESDDQVVRVCRVSEYVGPPLGR